MPRITRRTHAEFRHPPFPRPWSRPLLSWAATSLVPVAAPTRFARGQSMLNSTALYTGRRSATVAPAPTPTPASEVRPGRHPHHAVEISRAPQAWRSAAEVSASHRSEASRSESEGAAPERASEGRRHLNERTCAWTVCGLITGGILGGAAGAAAVLMARASGDHTTLDPVQGGAVGAMAGAVMGSVAGCLLNACCGDPE